MVWQEKDGDEENHQVLVCPKHFAVNEQETYRRGNAKKQYDAVDSVITERAARELYLKPFEMLVKKANVRCIMTSFKKKPRNLRRNSDLCNRILREEWGYEGFLVTDWGIWILWWMARMQLRPEMMLSCQADRR